MYLIYCTTDGRIFREVDNYRIAEGQIEAGINGTYTLIYPDAVHPSVLEITQEQFEALGDDYAKWLVQDGQIVENPNYNPFNRYGYDYQAGYEQALLDMMEVE